MSFKQSIITAAIILLVSPLLWFGLYVVACELDPPAFIDPNDGKTYATMPLPQAILSLIFTVLLLPCLFFCVRYLHKRRNTIAQR
jgi:hypothetical protein